MYLLVVGERNGSVNYFGPFITQAEAAEYGKACEECFEQCRWHIKSLIVTRLEYLLLFH